MNVRNVKLKRPINVFRLIDIIYVFYDLVFSLSIDFFYKNEI
jgi:hypothetical protein